MLQNYITDLKKKSASGFFSLKNMPSMISVERLMKHLSMRKLKREICEFSQGCCIMLDKQFDHVGVIEKWCINWSLRKLDN